MTLTTRDPAAEYDRQCETLIRLGYPALLGLAPDELLAQLEPLRDTAVNAAIWPAGSQPDAMPSNQPDAMPFGQPDAMPFGIVIDSPALSPNRMVELTQYRRPTGRGAFRPGRSMISDNDVARFRPIEGCEAPATAYVIVDVQRGAEYCGMRPSEAQPLIEQRGRSGLTIAEGIALLTHNPASLERNKCFMLLSSRCGDARVPALWISDSAPKLGWCWWNNMHTWLGFASCERRSGPSPTGS